MVHVLELVSLLGLFYREWMEWMVCRVVGWWRNVVRWVKLSMLGLFCGGLWWWIGVVRLSGVWVWR